MHDPNSVRVPLSALWPPVALLAADLMLLGVAAYYRLTVPAALFAVGFAVLAFDIRGRIHDFHSARTHLKRGRNPARVAKSFQFSWCGRVACQSAAFAVNAAIGARVARYYRISGYRWFHIFPDNTFTLSSPFLTVRFWEITLRGNNRARQRLEEVENDAVSIQDFDVEDHVSTEDVIVRQAA
jgi:hypothetical protein